MSWADHEEMRRDEKSLLGAKTTVLDCRAFGSGPIDLVMLCVPGQRWGWYAECMYVCRK